MIVSRLRFPLLAIVTLLFAARAAAVEPIQELEPTPAAADSADPATPAKENAWSHGVPEESRRAAEALFYEGNRLMKESITLTAAAKYREALGHWDHPNIHYNLAVALMTLDQPVETYEHLQQATKYGPKPLEQERYEHARNYLTLLDKQLARVKISCSVPEGVVELDGRQIFETPGEYQGLLRAGRHTVVARREGYVTNQSNRMLEGGKTASIDLELKTIAELTTTTRRWSAWKPWAVTVGGALVLGAGAALVAGGNQKVSNYDRDAVRCTPSTRCSAAQVEALEQVREDGQKMQKIGVAGYAAGGAVLATGAVLVFLNRGQSHVRTYDSSETAAPPPAGAPTVELSPLVTPDAPGLALRVRF